MQLETRSSRSLASLAVSSVSTPYSRIPIKRLSDGDINRPANEAVGSSKSIGRFVSPLGKREELMMKGDFFNTSANIVSEAFGAPVAVINRKFFNASELLFGKQTYAVTIAPNVDMAIIVAMCICLDERRSET